MLLRRYLPGLLLLAALIGLTLLLRGQHFGEVLTVEPVPLETRLAQELPALATLEERYTAAGRLDDLSLDTVTLLDRLPGVAAVHSNGVKNPTARIVHFLDYHTEDEQDLAAEFPHATAAEVAKMHRDLLLRVELVQAEELAALRCLAKHHGIVGIWAEGLTPETLPAYLDTILRLKNGEPAANLELLKLGAACRAFISGHLQAVGPLDTAKELDASKTLEPAAVKARDAGIAQRLAKAIGTCQVIVLGGAHDLTLHLPAGVEYLRVEVLSYAEFAGP